MEPAPAVPSGSDKRGPHPRAIRWARPSAAVSSKRQLVFFHFRGLVRALSVSAIQLGATVVGLRGAATADVLDLVSPDIKADARCPVPPLKVRDLEPAFDQDPLALLQPRGVLSLPAGHVDTEPIGALLALASCVRAHLVDGDPELCDLALAGGIAQLGVAAQIAHDCHTQHRCLSLSSNRPSSAGCGYQYQSTVAVEPWTRLTAPSAVGERGNAGSQRIRAGRSVQASEPGARQIGPSTPSAWSAIRRVVVNRTDSGSEPRCRSARYAW